MPAGAYVTLEHEYILILRKNNKRNFSEPEEKLNRRQSAFFWEERNSWFSDIWDFKGKKQDLNHKSLRKRSGAFPFELAYRLINIYSVKGDTVLDPFLGTGTTMFAAMASSRNSIGVEIDRGFQETEIFLPYTAAIEQSGNTDFRVTHSDMLVFKKGYNAAGINLNSSKKTLLN